MPAPSTSTISSSEAIWDTPRPCTAASAVSRSAASTTTTAGSTAISGASADLNTATSSAITKAMENHWTWPPVLPEVALVSARVATVPAVCTANPGGGRGRADRVAHLSDQGGLLGGGEPARLRQRGQHRELLGLPVGRRPGVPHRDDAGDPGQRALEPHQEGLVGAGHCPARPGGDHGDRGQRGLLQRRGQLGRLLAGRAGRQERGVVALRHAGQRRQQRHRRGHARHPGQHDGPAEAHGQPPGRGKEGTHEGHRGRPGCAFVRPAGA